MNAQWYYLLLIFLFTTYSYAGQKIPHLLVLGIPKPGIVIPQVRGLLDGLEEAGYVEGKNLIIEFAYAENAQRLRDHLTNLAQKKVDVIVATSANETAIAKQITSTIPIIFAPANRSRRYGVRKVAQPTQRQSHRVELHAGRGRQWQAASDVQTSRASNATCYVVL